MRKVTDVPSYPMRDKTTVASKKPRPQSLTNIVPSGLVIYVLDTKLNLDWTSVVSASSYKVYRAATQNGTYSVVGTPSTSNYLNTGLDNGTTYWYKVTAIVNGVESAPCAPVSGVPAGTVPAAPTNLSATAGNTQIVLNWDDVVGATSYKVYRGTATGVYNPTPIATPAVSNYTDTGLTNGVEYFYTVTAVNATGESNEATEDSATPVSAVVFGINLRSAIASHEAENTIGLGTIAGPEGYTWVRTPIGMDNYGNTERPFQANAGITAFVEDAIAAGLDGILFLMNANPKLDGTHIISLNGGVPWTVQSRPPATIDAWILQGWLDAVDTALAAAGASIDIAVQLFNEQGKGGNQTPQCASTAPGATLGVDGKYYNGVYVAQTFGTIEAAWMTRMGDLAEDFKAAVDPSVLIGGLAIENDETDTDHDGTADTENEFASCTGTGWDKLEAASDFMSFHCYGRKSNGGVYIGNSALWQSEFLTKIGRGVTRMQGVTNLPIWVSEFGRSVANGPTDGTKKNTARDNDLEGLKTLSTIAKAFYYTAMVDTNFNAYDAAGAALDGISVKP